MSLELDLAMIDPDRKIQTAIATERMENPDCPVVSDLIAQCIKNKDYEMALKIAEDSLKPRIPLIVKLKRLLYKKH